MKTLIPRLPGAVAQLVERLVRNEKVSGSIPLGSTRKLQKFSAFCLKHPTAPTMSLPDVMQVQLGS